MIEPHLLRMFEGNISDRRRVAGRIQDLANEPRPTGCEKLSGKDRHRLRQGDYRIVYAIDDKKRAITVVRIGHRKEVHR